ncbi:hypothetical protein AVEN_49795-1 [Araneus ventricosus]|uniref:Uncharacterized protein n=1 Tax=Araneus ventricosus TaxID=182803 RepID=A0A4Y2V442_ARAVE|nr:hypothetical protein AVEN_49795-1 [Araneus ventricosus]
MDRRPRSLSRRVLQNFCKPSGKLFERGIQLVDKYRSEENLRPISLHSFPRTAGRAPPVGETLTPLLLQAPEKGLYLSRHCYPLTGGASKNFAPPAIWLCNFNASEIVHDMFHLSPYPI